MKVGAVRFELTTFWTRTKRATRLRYAPIENRNKAYRFPSGSQSISVILHEHQHSENAVDKAG